MPSLRDIDLYLKRRAMAEGAGNANEKAEARRQVEQMEQEHPGIRKQAKAVQAALDGEGAPTTEEGWKGAVAEFFKQTAQTSASRFADEFAGEVSGASRFEPLKIRECVLKEHRCAEGQVCLEIRARVKDVNSSKARAAILDGIEEQLLKLAED